ncbi:sulfurtransferase [Oceanospirillum beijerinckii]|uniref:sulfurtransferase n=1 Tax=Oceanospirillum beijerinckii TaxID=64976 RepID=UPI0004078A3E|nr:sulfurtransferase [Oceanospirillum beijerinckii]MAC46127.1 sulfurtransferase [Oceanospirillum sp.]
MSSEENLLPLLISTDQLEAVLGEKDLLIIDVSCTKECYDQGHVPGAVFLDYKRLFCGAAPVANKLPSVEQLSQLFSELGLTRDSHVVAYDDEGGGWAGRLLWTLEIMGHSRYSYLNGGILAWRGDGKSQSQEQTPAIASQYQADILVPQVRIKLDELQEKVGQTGFAIWDSRSEGEYKGTTSKAARAGHIPTAVHYEWTRAMDKDNNLCLRDMAELMSELETAGLNIDQEVATYCQSHHRSGFTWLLGKILGFKQIRAYDGSWNEWGNRQDTPIET